MKKNKSTKWITIPDKKVSKSTLNQAPSDKKERLVDRVDHKFFWGTGFLAVLLFGSFLVFPNFYSQLKANLFDGEFTIVPDTATQQEQGALFGGGASEDDVVDDGDEGLINTEVQVVADQEVVNENVVQANVDAVPIQLDSFNASNEMPEVEDQPVQESAADPEPIQDNQEANAELQALIQNLTNQLEELKKSGQLKDDQIQALSDELDSQQAAVEMAAQERETQQQVVQNQGSLFPAASDEMVSDSVNSQYRINVHTVEIDPSSVLVQSRNGEAVESEQVALGGPDHAHSETHDMNEDHSELNASLSTIESNPETGPFDSLLLAFALASLGVLMFGIFKAARV